MASEKKLLNENVRRLLLKEYIMNKTERTGLGGLEIQRTPMGTRITLTAERPGMIIGRKGSAIKELTREVEDDFKFDNPQIEVQECRNPHLNAQIMAQRLASSLEKGWHFRRAGHSTVRRIMQAGAKGCQVILTGKLTGQRHRMEKFKDGHIKFCGEQALIWMEEGFATAKVKLGSIGVKVQIMDPEARLPDEIEVADPLPQPAVDTGAVVRKPEGAQGDVPEGEAGEGEDAGKDKEGKDAPADDKKEGEGDKKKEGEEEPEKSKRKRRKKTDAADDEEGSAQEKEGDDLPQLPTKPEEETPDKDDAKKGDAEPGEKGEGGEDKPEPAPGTGDAGAKEPNKEKPAKEEVKKEGEDAGKDKKDGGEKKKAEDKPEKKPAEKPAGEAKKEDSGSGDAGGD